jgi:hypothetical protein
MRVRWPRFIVTVFGLGCFAWYFGLFAPLTPALLWLASQPETWDAFSDPQTGTSDALLMLISFFLLSPFVLFIGFLVLTFVVIVILVLSEPLFRAVRAPSWLCVALVLVGIGIGAYVYREVWMPQTLYVLGLAARAGLVYFAQAVPVPR